MTKEEISNSIYDSLINDNKIEDNLIYYKDICNVCTYVAAGIILLLLITMIVLLYVKDNY